MTTDMTNTHRQTPATDPLVRVRCSDVLDAPSRSALLVGTPTGYSQMLAFTAAQADAFGHLAAEAEDGIECLGCTS
jgi:hypothetical protein